MDSRYFKRQRISMAVAAVAWLTLALCTRLWGCSNEEEHLDAFRDEGTDTPRIANLEDGGVGTDGDGGPLDGTSSVKMPILEAISGEEATEEDERMLSSLSMDDVDSAPIEYFLLLGLDRSGKLPGRTDSIMVVAARHGTSDIGVISVPRDLWVDIPGAEPGRINKVYRVGDMLHGKGGGRDLIRKVLKTELGVEVDYITGVDFSGFSTVVDLLGGIEVNVACPLKDNFIDPGAKDGYVSFSIDAGTHLMDGKTALLFSRSRHGRSDMDRARRQQAVLLGLKQRAMSFDVIPRLPMLLGAFRKHVDTDVDLAGAFRLVNLARRADLDDLHGLVLREPLVYEWRSPEGKSAVKLNRAAFDRELAGLFDAPLPGSKEKPVCKAADVALRWKELASKRKERKRKEKLALDEIADAGI